MKTTFFLLTFFALIYTQEEAAVSSGEVGLVVVSTENNQENAVVGGCGCTGTPSTAKSVFGSFLSALSQNLQADLSVYFVPGAFPSCVVETLAQLEAVSFEDPVYLIDQPNSVAGKVGWTYQFKGSEQNYSDESLVFSVTTDANQLISELLIAPENDNFHQRLPKPKPASVYGLVQEFFNGLSSFNHHSSLAHTNEDFTFNVRGDVSLLPHHLARTVTRSNFDSFKDQYNEVFDFASKSLRCSLKAEDEDTSSSQCLLVGKYNRVKFCIDGVVIAQATDGLLSSIDYYIGGNCDPKAKFEDDEAREERLRRENEKKEAKLREEERRLAKEKEEAEKKIQREKEEAERKALKEKEEAEKKTQKTKKSSEKSEKKN